jgi:hypothetical protein
LFPNTPEFGSIKVKLPEKEGDIPEGLEAVLDKMGKSSETLLKLEQMYKEKYIPIGAFANLIKHDVLAVWRRMISKPDLGLRCCYGEPEERVYATSLLENKPKLIIDIISLMTLHGIQAGDFVLKAFGKLGVAQSTIDLLKQRIDEEKGIRLRGFIMLGKEGTQLTGHEIRTEEVRDYIEYLEDIIRWIENNCEVIPCNAALNMKAAWKRRLDEIFGRPFIDTILIASEPGNILYSDDERLRAFSKSEFNVDGVWTQIILMHCLKNNIFEKVKYNEMVVKLVCSHYYHTSVDADVLIESARQAKWTPSQPYTTVLQILSGNKSEESSVLGVATEFLFQLWKQPILSEQRNYLILSLLDTITVSRISRRVLEKLISNIKRRFILLPLAEREILSLIEIWEKIHIT